MAFEIISWSTSMKNMWPSWGSNSRPLGLQSDPLPTVLLSPRLSQLMRFWYLSHRRPAKAQASLRIGAVLPEPSLFANMNFGSRRRVRPKSRHLAPRYGCAYVFGEWIYGGQKVPKSHELAPFFIMKADKTTKQWSHSSLFMFVKTLKKKMNTFWT